MMPVQMWYEMHEQHIVVPRAWGVARFGKAEYRGRTGAAIRISRAPAFRLDATRRQPEAVQAVLDAMRGDFAGGLVCLFTGAGKTVIVNWIISELQLKTLVVAKNKLGALPESICGLVSCHWMVSLSAS